MTRAGPAKSLGMAKRKGHLGVGADADIAIYAINPKTTDSTQKPELLVKALENAAYTIKGGEIVVKDGEIVGLGSSPRPPPGQMRTASTTRKSPTTSSRSS